MKRDLSAAEVIILANSRKLSNRCIAGIDISTGKWIRPISDRPDKAIPWSVRNIGGEEPKLLDVLNIPLSSVALDNESQPENRLIEKGKWTKLRESGHSEIKNYLQQSGLLFYNKSDRVLYVRSCFVRWYIEYSSRKS